MLTLIYINYIKGAYVVEFMKIANVMTAKNIV